MTSPIKSKVTFEMVVGEVGRPCEWIEPVPEFLNGRAAPHLDGQPALRRAQLAVEWFTSTLRRHERARALRKVIRVERSLIYPFDIEPDESNANA